LPTQTAAAVEGREEPGVPSCTIEQVVAANAGYKSPCLTRPAPHLLHGAVAPAYLSALRHRTYLDVGCDALFRHQGWVLSAAEMLLEGAGHGLAEGPVEGEEGG